MKSNASSRPLVNDLYTLLDTSGPASIRPLILVAHPDDETLGATSVLHRFPLAEVLILTDGAPRSERFRSAPPSVTRFEYEAIRRQETLRALACASISPHRVHHFDCIDQEVIHNVLELVTRLLAFLKENRIDQLMTHAYDGGHPDHDAAALIAHLAMRSLEREGRAVPRLREMALYHGRDGSLVTGEFLNRFPDEVIVELTPDEQELKQRMVGCYASQKDVLNEFGSVIERFRPAISYDFTEAPHPGKLWYERLEFPVTGAKWREFARATLQKLDQVPCH
ncbi:MAG TPA: PIG-L family deacetylase [Terriglobales bacterium]|jgi:LmbE family N-acetylglucosaminyl deacetylase